MTATSTRNFADFDNCMCGQARPFVSCCKALLSGARNATSAEELMRSRYSAFYLADIEYLEKTHDPETRHTFNLEANREWAESVNFWRLEILRVSENKDFGSVEFKAYFSPRDQRLESLRPASQSTLPSALQVHHEHSTFRRFQNRWYYRS